jgi:hypothetical protein
MKRLKGGVLANGLNSFVSAVFNTFPNSCFGGGGDIADGFQGGDHKHQHQRQQQAPVNAEAIG